MADTILEHHSGRFKPDHVDKGVPVYVHDINQFDWYSDAVSKTMDDKNDEDEEYNPKPFLSCVRFCLPYTMGKEVATPPSYLTIVGDGHSVMDAYFSRCWNSYPVGVHLTQNDFDKAPAALWHLFSYRDEKIEVKPELTKTVKLHKIFGTEITPLLKTGEYEIFSDRVYNFECSNSDTLSVIAQRRENKSEQKIILRYKTEGLHKKATEDILVLKHTDNAGYFDDKLKHIPSTDKFTFPYIS